MKGAVYTDDFYKVAPGLGTTNLLLHLLLLLLLLLPVSEVSDLESSPVSPTLVS
jgi:hypothetical protein